MRTSKINFTIVWVMVKVVVDVFINALMGHLLFFKHEFAGNCFVNSIKFYVLIKVY